MSPGSCATFRTIQPSISVTVLPVLASRQSRPSDGGGTPACLPARAATGRERRFIETRCGPRAFPATASLQPATSDAATRSRKPPAILRRRDLNIVDCRRHSIARRGSLRARTPPTSPLTRMSRSGDPGSSPARANGANARQRTPATSLAPHRVSALNPLDISASRCALASNARSSDKVDRSRCYGRLLLARASAIAH